MSHSIVLHGTAVQYTIRNHARAKRLRLTVYAGGEIVVTIPKGTRQKTVERFIHQQADWLLHQLQETIQPSNGLFLDCTGSQAEYKRDKESARVVIHDLLTKWNNHYQYRFNRVSIRNQRTRWGSCSSNKNLSFNYRLLYLPEYLREYVVVHELCHLQEMNHSPAFWKLVAETIPDYKERRADLKQIAIPYRK